MNETNEVTKSMTITQNSSMDDTMPVPAVHSSEGESDFDALFEAEQEEWPERGPAKGLQLPWPVAVLVVVLVAGAGIWGGAYLQRHHSSQTSVSALSSLFGSRSGTSGSSSLPRFSGGSFSSSGGTSGTVTDISGDTLYVTTASGSLVTVKVNPTTTTVTRNAKSSLSDLEPGDSVTVQGTTAKGVVNATSVSATQAGVSSGFGGFSFPGGSASGG